MKDNKKKAARVKRKPSRNLRTPRKRHKPGPTAAELRARHVDTVDLLYRRGQIDGRQLAAAMEYREAVDLCRSTGASTLANFDRVRTGGIASPTEAQMRAAGRIADAARLLGMIDYNLLTLVACDGFTIDQAAARLFGRARDGKATRGDSEHTGRRLRVALATLGETWFPTPIKVIRAQRAAADDETAPQPGRIERGRVMHATRWRIFDI